jgi:transposase
MVAIPTLEDEDARRPSRERESLVGERPRIINRMKAILAWLGVRGFNPKLRKASQRLDDLRTPEDLPLPANTVDELRRDMARLAMVCEQIKALEQARLANLEQAPGTGSHAMVRLIANVIGVGIETADMLVQEVLSRTLRDRGAVARFAGLTGAPNGSGSRRRERWLAKSGNARVRRGLIQLAWRFLRFQKDSALAQWYRARTEGPARLRRLARADAARAFDRRQGAAGADHAGRRSDAAQPARRRRGRGDLADAPGRREQPVRLAHGAVGA